MPTGVFTHSITKGYKTDEGTTSSVVTSRTGDSELGIEDNVAASTTNKHYALAVTKTQILMMCIFASKALTIKTNSSTTPQETITLTAGQQIVADITGGDTCPFSADVTGFYVTNADSSNASNLKMRFLLSA